jgi:hypothetical protein
MQVGKITISGAVPGPETNGIGPWSDKLMEGGRILYPVVAMITVDKVVDDKKHDVQYPVLAIAHIELVTTEEDVKAHAALLGSALGMRTGAMALPFEAGDEAPGGPDAMPPDPADGNEDGED